MSDDALVRRVCATYRTQRILVGERVPHPLVTIVRSPARPAVWDANHGSAVHAHGHAEIEAVLEALDQAMPADVRVRKFFCDVETPPPFVARLVLDGFAREGTLQLVLEGDLAIRPRSLVIRRTESEADWALVADLIAENVAEDCAKDGRDAPSSHFLRQMSGFRREMGSALHVWIAQDLGDCGVFASWDGVDGMGMVEWLFVRRAWRRRGIATALIAHGVADARERGAREVMIGASDGPDAVPRRLYASLGFRPVCITEEYSRFV